MGKLLTIFFKIVFSATATLLFFLSFNIIDDVPKKYDLYNRLKDTAVTIEAEIVRTEQYNDDGDDKYKAYISYSYGNKVCTDIYYEDYSAKPEIGEKVEVTVDPENPEVFMPEKPIVFLPAIGYLGLCIFGIEIMASQIAFDENKKKHKDIYITPVPTVKQVETDLKYAINQKFENRYIYLGIMTLITLIDGIYYYVVAKSFTMVIWAVLWNLVLLLGYLFYQKGDFTANRIPDNIQISADYIVKGEITSDSDNNSEYYWKFKNFGDWKVKSKEFVSNTCSIYTDDTEIFENHKATKLCYIAVDTAKRHNSIIRVFDSEEFPVVE